MDDVDLLYVVGAGGAGREIAAFSRSQRRWRRIAFAVERSLISSSEVSSTPVLALESTGNEPADFVVGVGDPAARRRLAGLMQDLGHQPVSLVMSDLLDGSVEVREGAVISPSVTTTVDATVGSHAYLNVGVSLSHDVRVGSCAVLSPAVTICGHVTIGDSVFIGAGATVVNGRPGRPLTIGDGAVIAAGACVTRNVEAGALVAGVPAVRKG